MMVRKVTVVGLVAVILGFGAVVVGKAWRNGFTLRQMAWEKRDEARPMEVAPDWREVALYTLHYRRSPKQIAKRRAIVEEQQRSIPPEELARRARMAKPIPEVLRRGKSPWPAPPPIETEAIDVPRVEQHELDADGGHRR